MKKLAYTAPVVEITKWEKQDIITTSGLETISVSEGVVASLGDANVTAKIDYKSLQQHQK